MNNHRNDTDNAVALVTGGARRVGAAVVRTLHDAGFRVAIHCRSSSAQAEELARELCSVRADSAQVFVADLTDPAQVQDLAAQVADRFGRLDALVHNASVFRPGDLDADDSRVWQETRAVHVEAPWLLTRQTGPLLRHSHGTVVHILDIYIERPLPGYLAYSVSKAAMHGLLRAQAREMAPEVRVNGIAPGAILWPETPDDRDHEAIIESTALGRAGRPEDIASAVLFLVRDARYCTGEVLTVDGGRSLSPGF